MKKKMASVFLAVFFLSINPSGALYGQVENRKPPEFSRSFLGLLKKSMRFKTKISELADRYNLDKDMIIAIMMYESGGNDGLVSGAGAEGLMQIMPDTFQRMKRLYGTKSKFESAIRYLKYLDDKFGGNQDLVVMAYNGGEGRVFREKIKFETFQYLIGVSQFYTILKNHRKRLEERLRNLEIIYADVEESWQEISQKNGVSVLELKMYNPFLAQRGLRAKSAIAYPKNPSTDFIEKENTKNGIRFWYKVRLGDIYHYIANIFEISYKNFRKTNHLFFYSHIYPGTRMDITGSPYLK